MTYDSLPSITQTVEQVEEGDKLVSLITLLNGLTPDTRVIIFVSSNDVADRVASFLFSFGIYTISIQDGFTQDELYPILCAFNTGEQRLLIATHTAAHGLNIRSDTPIVIIYDLPSNIDVYVQCVSRADQHGQAIVYFNRSDLGILRDLVQVLNDNKQDVPEELQSMARVDDASAYNLGFSPAPSWP